MSGPEYKYFDTNSGNVAVGANTWTLLGDNGLNMTVVGTGAENRIGRRIIIKSLVVNFTCQQTAGTTATVAGISKDEVFRIAIVQDKQCNGAMPVGNTIWNLDNCTSAQINMANSKRFVILKEFIVRMENVPMSTSYWNTNTNAFVQGYAWGETKKMWRYYKKLNIRIDYATTPGGTITDVRSNNLLIYANSINGDGEAVAVARIRFIDD